MPVRLLLITLLLLTSIGCAAKPLNPSFPVTRSQARDALRAMQDSPTAIQRPVVVVGGILDPGLVAGMTRNQLRKALADDVQILAVGPGSRENFEQARTHLIQAINKRWPSDDPSQTIEVDVVAVSMGGLVARYAALDHELPGARDANDDDAHLPQRLRIARLFTIATPHRGAVASGVASFDDRVAAMAPDSPFLQGLDAAPRDYDIIAYARLNDLIVGEAMASPQGQTAYWVPVHSFEEGHIGCWDDPRIMADIARRLRSEEPLTQGQPAPLPGQPAPQTEGM